MIEVDNGVFFTGDNVLDQRVARIDDGTFSGNIRAIDRAPALPVKVVVPGYGKPGEPAIVKRQRDYFQALFDAVKVKYDAGERERFRNETCGGQETCRLSEVERLWRRSASRSAWRCWKSSSNKKTGQKPR
jgi:glyoxylase-like metal-dependent hydrolase (beta-lactamase superfamily II)